jgi:hypothetical protein
MGIEVGSDTPLGSIIVGLVMLLFGGAGWYFAWKGGLAASASSEWQPVDAKILRARATQNAHGDWSPDVAYEYVIAGERYESSQVRIFTANRTSLQGARAVAHRYHATQRVTAYVDPSDHMQAVLIPGPQRSFALVVVSASVALAAGGTYFIFQGVQAW